MATKKQSRPIVEGLANPRGVTAVYGTPIDWGSLPEKIRIGRRIANGRFKLEAHYPAKHFNDKKEYVDKRKAGSYCRFYDNKSPFFVARTVWDETSQPGMHMVVKNRNETYRFLLTPKADDPTEATVIGAYLVHREDGVPVLCSGPIGELKAVGDDGDFKVTAYKKHGIRCPKKDNSGNDLAGEIPKTFGYTKRTSKKGPRKTAKDYCKPSHTFKHPTDIKRAEVVEEMDAYMDEQCTCLMCNWTGAYSDLAFIDDTTDGGPPGTDFMLVCPSCGEGDWLDDMMAEGYDEPCFSCDGIGTWDDGDCEYCHGSGMMSDNLRAEMAIYNSEYFDADCGCFKKAEGKTLSFMDWAKQEEASHLKKYGAEGDQHECITCAEPMGAIPKWSCECCGFLVGTQGDHEGCGDNMDGTVVCNHCYQEGHEVTTMITLDGNEVIFNSTCKGWDNEKHFGDREYEVTDEYVLGAESFSAEHYGNIYGCPVCHGRVLQTLNPRYVCDTCDEDFSRSELGSPIYHVNDFHAEDTILSVPLDKYEEVYGMSYEELLESYHNLSVDDYKRCLKLGHHFRGSHGWNPVTGDGAESFGAEKQDMMCCGESMEFYEAVDGSPDYFYCPVCEVSIITKEFDAEYYPVPTTSADSPDFIYYQWDKVVREDLTLEESGISYEVIDSVGDEADVVVYDGVLLIPRHLYEEVTESLSNGGEAIQSMADTFEPECITCDKPMGDNSMWGCVCCGMLVGTEGDHEGCGENRDGIVACNFCIQENHEYLEEIDDVTGEVITHSSCQDILQDVTEMDGAKTFEAPYAGPGATMDIGKDTALSSFTPEELTTSSAIHGDFDQASLDYSGHQNIEVRAEGWGKTCQVEDRDTDEPCTAPATVNLQDILMEYEVGSDPYEKMHLGEINEFFCKKHYDEMDDMWAETKGSEHQNIEVRAESSYHLSNTMDESQQEDTDNLKARASSPIIADYVQAMAEWGFNNQDHLLLWESMCLVVEADERGEFDEHIEMLEDNWVGEAERYGKRQRFGNRYVARNTQGEFISNVGVGASLKADRRNKSKTPASSGFGNKGDSQKTPPTWAKPLGYVGALAAGWISASMIDKAKE